MTFAAKVIPVIAVDGPSGSGKGVVCQALARHFGFHILDSGALYRVVGLAARKAGVDLDGALNRARDKRRLAEIATSLDLVFVTTTNAQEPLRILLAGEDVTSQVRTDEAGVDASTVAALPEVRTALFQRQRDFRTAPGLIADGRDMGTVVFPDAAAKIFLTASAQARAERRYNQLIDKGISVSLHDLFLSIQARDERDSSREVSPLIPADDATVVDSTNLAIDEVVARVVAIAERKVEKKLKRK